MIYNFYTSKFTQKNIMIQNMKLKTYLTWDKKKEKKPQQNCIKNRKIYIISFENLVA